jgi:hypothetical protein
VRPVRAIRAVSPSGPLGGKHLCNARICRGTRGLGCRPWARRRTASRGGGHHRCADLNHDPDDGDGMEFRLTYEGILLGHHEARGNNRADHKHEIRKKFHPQLRQLWKVNPVLRTDVVGNPDGVSSTPRLQALADGYTRCGYRFVPLVTGQLRLLCSLSILFLRPDEPGGALQSGDLDNRIKTLLDCLRLPNNTAELGRHLTPESDEDPFFCLLEDDSLVSHLSVETDILLQPTGERFDKNDARLVITVKIRPYHVHMFNLQFG